MQGNMGILEYEKTRYHAGIHTQNLVYNYILTISRKRVGMQVKISNKSPY